MGRALALRNGSRIAVIGGGPAGSFFAYFARKWAVKKGLDVAVTIFDGKNFLQRGPQGCNLCAGVIAESLNQRLAQEGIFLPEQRIINRVEGYTLHIDHKTLLLSCSDVNRNPIATVFRGNGPRYSTFPENISFDDYLLHVAQDQGARIVSEPVWDINLPKDKTKPLTLIFGQKNKCETYEADLVVGAFGVNTPLIKKFQELGFGYKPPSTLTTFQAEIRLEKEDILKHFGNTIHIFRPKSKTIRYASVVPKEKYITLTLIGKKDATKALFLEFLRLKEIKNKNLFMKPHCFCFPKIVISPAKNPFGDRLVLIGDSSFSRHYKNGLESAFITAQLAAEAVFCYGLDSDSLSIHFYQKAKKLISRDNSFGRLLFLMNNFISSVPLLSKVHLDLARKKADSGPSKKIKSILWNMFTGNVPYRQILVETLDFSLQFSLFIYTFRRVIKELKLLIKKIGKSVSFDGRNRPSKKP